jgi:hypothetical protein
MRSAERVFRHLVRALCSGSLRTYVLEPGLADLDYEAAGPPGAQQRLRLFVGYVQILTAVMIALPRDIALHRRPTFATVLRFAAAMAFPGLTTSFSTDTSLAYRSERNATRPEGET